MPELYNTRNVPAAFWIDENGKIARANDPIYAARRNRETSEEKVNHRYMDAVRDWVAMGPESEWVREAVDGSMGRQTWENQLALAHFRLGLYLHQQGHTEDAIAQFKKAHELEPGNWNYKRQTWNLGDISKDYGYENILSAIAGTGTAGVLSPGGHRERTAALVRGLRCLCAPQLPNRQNLTMRPHERSVIKRGASFCPSSPADAT